MAVNDPAINAASAVRAAQSRFREVFDIWSKCRRPSEALDESSEVTAARLACAAAHAKLGRTAAATVWGALAKAEVLAVSARQGTVDSDKIIAESLLADIARLRDAAG